MTVKLEVNETKGIITFAEHKCKDGYLQARQLNLCVFTKVIRMIVITINI